MMFAAKLLTFCFVCLKFPVICKLYFTNVWSKVLVLVAKYSWPLCEVLISLINFVMALTGFNICVFLLHLVLDESVDICVKCVILWSVRQHCYDPVHMTSSLSSLSVGVTHVCWGHPCLSGSPMSVGATQPLAASYTSFHGSTRKFSVRVLSLSLSQSNHKAVVLFRLMQHVWRQTTS